MFFDRHTSTSTDDGFRDWPVVCWQYFATFKEQSFWRNRSCWNSQVLQCQVHESRVLGIIVLPSEDYWWCRLAVLYVSVDYTIHEYQTYFRWFHDFKKYKRVFRGTRVCNVYPDNGYSRTRASTNLTYQGREPISGNTTDARPAAAMPDLRLPSQPQGITAHWLVPN